MKAWGGSRPKSGRPSSLTVRLVLKVRPETRDAIVALANLRVETLGQIVDQRFQALSYRLRLKRARNPSCAPGRSPT